MPKPARKKHQLLDGSWADLSGLDARARAFLTDLDLMGRRGVSYFEIYRAAVGPGSAALEGRNRVDRRLAQSDLYRAAEDIATRAGIRQGLVLAPEYASEKTGAPADFSMMSVTQAADFIGISRAAVYKAIEKGTLAARHIGNVTVVARTSADEYRRQRLGGPGGAEPGREHAPAAD